MPLYSLLLLAGGFVLLIKGADWLVDGASAAARRLGVRDIVIGLTVVSFGTSAPELIVSLFSALRGSTDLAVGNIVGSNIANILLILGVAACIYPLAVTRGTAWKEIPLALLAAVALTAMLNDPLLDGRAAVLTRSEGVVLLLLFAIFLYYTYGMSRITGAAEPPAEQRSLPAAGALVVLGIGSLVLGGKLIVDSAVALALGAGVSEGLIGLTVVAVGTSLPELATSAVAAYKKNADIAVGNIVGSNIFNILFILAITSLVAPLPAAATLNGDLAVMLTASLLLFAALFVGRRHELERWQGAGFLGLYAVYVLFAVWRG